MGVAMQILNSLSLSNALSLAPTHLFCAQYQKKIVLHTGVRLLGRERARERERQPGPWLQSCLLHDLPATFFLALMKFSLSVYDLYCKTLLHAAQEFRELFNCAFGPATFLGIARVCFQCYAPRDPAARFHFYQLLIGGFYVRGKFLAKYQG